MTAIPLNAIFLTFFGSFVGILTIFVRHSLADGIAERKKIREQIEEKKRQIIEQNAEAERQAALEKQREEEEKAFEEYDQPVFSGDEETAKETGEKKLRPSADAEINTLFKKADALLGRGLDIDAEKIFIQILAINEDHLKTNISLALIYLKRGEYTKAESMQRKLTEMRPRDPAIHTNLGLALFNQKKFEEALEAFQHAVEIDPARGARHANLGKVYFAIGEFEAAEECFHKAVQLEPRSLEFLFLLADSKKEQKNFPGAKKVYERILEISPFDEEAKAAVKSLTILGF